MMTFALTVSFLLSSPTALAPGSMSLQEMKSPDASPDTSPVSALNPRYTPPPKPSRWGPKVIIASGTALAIAGMTGLILGGGCQTRDAQDRCVDPYGGSTIYPSMVVLGLGVTITGGYWYRRLDTQKVDKSR